MVSPFFLVDTSSAQEIKRSSGHDNERNNCSGGIKQHYFLERWRKSVMSEELKKSNLSGDDLIINCSMSSWRAQGLPEPYYHEPHVSQHIALGQTMPIGTPSKE
jgi:hypothetical protein